MDRGGNHRYVRPVDRVPCQRTFRSTKCDVRTRCADAAVSRRKRRRGLALCCRLAAPALPRPGRRTSRNPLRRSGVAVFAGGIPLSASRRRERLALWSSRVQTSPSLRQIASSPGVEPGPRPSQGRVQHPAHPEDETDRRPEDVGRREFRFLRPTASRLPPA